MLGGCSISPGAAARPLGIGPVAHCQQHRGAPAGGLPGPEGASPGASSPACGHRGGGLPAPSRPPPPSPPPPAPAPCSSCGTTATASSWPGPVLSAARRPAAGSVNPGRGGGRGATWRCSHSGDGGRAEPHLAPCSAVRDSGVCAARGPPCRATGRPTGHGCCATVEVVGRRPREDPGRAWGSALPCGVCPPPAWGPQSSIQGAQAAGGGHEEAAGACDWIKECSSDLPATPAPCHAAQRVRSSHSAVCFHAQATGSWTSASCSEHAPGSPCPVPPPNCRQAPPRRLWRPPLARQELPVGPGAHEDPPAHPPELELQRHGPQREPGGHLRLHLLPESGPAAGGPWPEPAGRRVGAAQPTHPAAHV
ncbi:uncharacterized protein LOC142826413 [Pelodiscus sinensis]|uniref:uncharacterized protein LOC142826413 n=1 Tax=Pelodiscus sinensis TaxID=13735 RepID=UPI003F6A8489